MSKAFDEYILNKPEINIISKENLSLLKIKLGKSHRKESDWAAIKDILNSHDVITVNIRKPQRGIKSVNGVLCEDNSLFVFTNMDDCEKHIQYLHSTTTLDRFVNIGSLPFESVIEISNQTGMKVYIDLVDEKNQRIIIYSPQLKKLEIAILADRN